MLIESFAVKLSLSFLLLLIVFTNSVYACTTVIVGKNRTVDGSVMVAHNEDLGSNAAEKVVIVPEKQYVKGDMMQMYYGALLLQPDKTGRYIATSIFEKSYYPGDYTFGFNEKGVAAANNAASLHGVMSYDESVAYKNPQGIIWTECSQLILERADTARAGVLLLGAIVEKYGLSGDSATMLAIADTNEGWWMEIAGNGQWVAKRVGDDEAVMRANGFRIGAVDFEDKANWLYSERIIDCAVENGWYKDGEKFSFKDVYGEPIRNNRAGNVMRENRLDNLLGSMPKVAVADLMKMMRDVYQDTPEYRENKVGSPFHSDNYTIANEETDASAIVELKNDVNMLGNCMWVCMANPATGVYVPIHLGADQIYGSYAKASEVFSDSSAYWQYTELERIADLKYGDLRDDIAATWLYKEKSFIKQAKEKEAIAQRLFAQGKNKEACKLLTEFDTSVADETDKCLDKMLAMVKSEVYKRE